MPHWWMSDVTSSAWTAEPAAVAAVTNAVSGQLNSLNWTQFERRLLAQSAACMPEAPRFALKTPPDWRMGNLHP